MIHLMSAAVMPAGNYGTYIYSPASVKDLAEVVNGVLGPYKCSIGYQQNVELIEQWTGVIVEVDRIEVTFQPGDKALVMRRKTRVGNEDWEFAWVSFLGFQAT